MASEYEPNDGVTHVIVDAGKRNRLDFQTGLFEHFAAQPVVDGFIDAQDTARRFQCMLWRRA
jgi:hypothetical protein